MDYYTTADRAIARSIKQFLEPRPGSKDKHTVKEIIDHIHAAHPTLTIKKEDIYDFLNSFYVPATVKRLLNLISEEIQEVEETGETIEDIKTVETNEKEPAQTEMVIPNSTSNFTHTVWDCSSCHNDIAELQKIFLAGTPQNNNLFLSVTFEELYQQLAPNRRPQQNDAEFIPNVKKLIQWILSDHKNEHSIAVEVEKTSSYTDDTLISYCSEHGYRLFTQDYFLAIRAKSRGIIVKTNFTTTVQQQQLLSYSPNPNGKTFILDTDIFKYLDFAQIISIANSEEAGKFLITTATADYFEANQDKCRDFVHLLVVDTDNYYSFYTEDENDKNLNLMQLATKYNGFVVTSSIETAFTCKMKNIDYYFAGNPLLATKVTSAKKEKNTTSSTTQKDVTIKTSKTSTQASKSTASKKVGSNLVTLPFFNTKTEELNLKRLRKQPDVSISVFTENGSLATPVHNCITIKNGYTIFKTCRIFESGVETFDFTVYAAVRDKGSIMGKVIYKQKFTKENLWKKVPREFQHAANSAYMFLSA